jgi:hypothetical protein
MKKINRLALLVKTDCQPDSFRGAYAHTTCRFVRINSDGHLRNLIDDYELPFYYDGLTITSQQDSRQLEHSYGWDFRYQDAYSVDYRAVKKMAKTMRKIETGLTKLHNEFGEPSKFSDYVLRIAKVMKVKTFVFPVSEYGSSYSENEYQFVDDFSYAKNKIDNLEMANVEKLKDMAA